MIKVYSILRALSDENRAEIDAACRKYGYDITYFNTVEEAYGNVADGEVVFCSSPALLTQMKDVRWVACANAGVDNFTSTGIFDSGDVLLTNSSGAYGLAISEHILMVTLMLLRRMPEYQEITGRREWRMHIPIRSISGSTIALIGTGNIGQMAAERFRALGARKLIGFNRSGRKPEQFDEVYKMEEFAKNVGDVDVAVMCVPGTAETACVVGREEIAALPETAFLVNVGRGTTLDQEALIDALDSGRLAGAALDVAVPEPLPADHPLWTARNCLITPHCSGDYGLKSTVDTLTGYFCENLRRYAEGEELIKRVDIAAGY